MSRWGPLQAQPPGLLGLLNLKNLGKNPDALLGDVQPTIELGEWYQAQQRNVAFASVSTNTANTSFQVLTTPAALRIPNNEWWYVWAATAYVQLNVGDTWASEFRVQYRAPLSSPLTGTTSQVIFELGCSPGFFYSPAAAVADLMVGVHPRRLFGPSTEFGLSWAQATFGANRTFSLGLEYTILPA